MTSTRRVYAQTIQIDSMELLKSAPVRDAVPRREEENFTLNDHGSVGAQSWARAIKTCLSKRIFSQYDFPSNMVTARIDLQGLHNELNEFKSSFDVWTHQSVASAEARKEDHFKNLREFNSELSCRARPGLAFPTTNFSTTSLMPSTPPCSDDKKLETAAERSGAARA